MNTAEIYDYIAQEKPKLVFLSGKTATGKSAFALQLNTGLGYAQLELDEQVRTHVITPFEIENEGMAFVEVYRNREMPSWVKAFVAGTQTALEKSFKKGEKVVMEGALANPQTLQELTKPYPGFLFAYFHPSDLEKYIGFLTNRFMLASAENNAGLPNAFWEMVDHQVFAQFCQDRLLTPLLKQTLTQYAEQSQKESEQRFQVFAQSFPQIIKVDV